jgi:ABC-type Mn2+/Zn2+ transport system ATPase subunit
MNPVIELSDLSFGYTSSDVLKSITAEFAAGEFVALVGPNGAGKSTLLKIMGGLIRAYRGSAKLFGGNAGVGLELRSACPPRRTQRWCHCSRHRLDGPSAPSADDTI